MMETLIRDLRYGMRMLVKNPAFTVIAVVTLALGIGANAALFSVVNGVLLKSLPFKDPDRLMFVWETNARLAVPTLAASKLNYRDWKEQNHAFDLMAARQPLTVNLTSGDKPEKIQGERISAEYFQVLGIDPIAGRAFTAEEDRPGGERVILLSYGLWQRRFGGDPKIIGQTIMMNGQSATVTGIMPNDYRPNVEFWVPLAINFNNSDRSLHEIQVIGRLAPGVTQEQAQSEMSNIAQGLAEQYPDLNTGWGIVLVPVHQMVVQNIRPALLILFGAVVVVLLIACTNVANLLLARAASREREIAIRIALGASRFRLVRQVLTESVLIALIGGALGVLIALWGTDFLIGLNPQGIPRAQEIGVDSRVLGFSLLVSIASGLVFGIVPALQASRPNLNETLKESGKSSAGNLRGRRVRAVLVVTEVALALMLLVGAGLLIKSFSKLQEIDAGFNREKLLTLQLFLPPAQYPKEEDQVAFYQESLRRLSSLPGVTSAATITQAPLAGGGALYIFSVEGQPLPSPSDAPVSSYRVVSPDYFQTLGIPLVRGRTFTEGDNLTAQSVIIVNQNMADAMWPGEDPVGRRMTVGVPLPGETPQYTTVVGVVGNVKHTTLSGETGMQMYQPAFQAPARNLTFVLRTAVEPMSIVESTRSAIAALDPTLPISNVKTMERIIYDSVAPFRFNLYLLGLFAIVAMILTAIGVYGVMSYSVTQRTQEIGIRMALGAQPGEVRALILKQGLVLSSVGLGIGLAGCVVVTRFMSSLLYGVSATDPITFAVVALFLAGVALAACYVPARKATRVEPIIALRYE
ncbi:MAG TPA: ABC transporter permease [Blastocatellia bacterium]|jgi:putative ABC transport system permease protein|nr:ABC transporter permease [Blastocatellia bacterium]